MNVSNASPQAGFHEPRLQSLHAAPDGCSFLVHATFDAALPGKYGAPSDVYSHWRLRAHGGAVTAELELTVLNKTATRLPEALWLAFLFPLGAAGSVPRVHPVVSGHVTQVGPEWLVPNASSHLHAMGGGLAYFSNSSAAATSVASAADPAAGGTNLAAFLTSTDAALVSLLAPRPSAFPTPLAGAPLPAATGIPHTQAAVNLLNNLWGACTDLMQRFRPPARMLLPAPRFRHSCRLLLLTLLPLSLSLPPQAQIT